MCKLIRQSCQHVVRQSVHVKINPLKFDRLPDFKVKHFEEQRGHVTADWTQQKSLKFFFLLDCANFCFWPKQGYQYQQLCESIKNLIDKIDTLELASLRSRKDLLEQVPQRQARLNCIWQVLTFVADEDTSFRQLVLKANKSAVRLLNIISRISCFQDHAIYKGEQVFFYKRAQLLISDIHSKFEGKGLGQFHDIDQLTVFADYRIPQLLRHLQIFQFSQELDQRVLNRKELDFGSQMETQIRAATVEAGSLIRCYLQKKGVKVAQKQVDYFLWQKGEEIKDKIEPHHRVLTIYY